MALKKTKTTAARKKATSPTQLDPSRTGSIRRRFCAEMQRRLASLSKAVWQLLVTEDAFGLEKPKPVPLIQNKIASGRYQFETNPRKLAQFQAWLDSQVAEGLLEVNGDDPWTGQYVESAYKQGVVRSYSSARPEAMATDSKFYLGGRAQFIADSFAMAADLNRVKLLSMRAFERMKGLTSTMKTQMSTALADGLADGLNPREVARGMKKTIDGLGRDRALTIARTEIIHAHAEGQLDGLERLGVDEVEAEVEFSTTGDNRVCLRCQELSGRTYTIAEARGIIPVHPNCRCAWVPAKYAMPTGRRTGSNRMILRGAAKVAA